MTRNTLLTSNIFGSYKKIQPQLFTLIITVIIILVIFSVYYIKQRNTSYVKNNRPRFVMFVDSFIEYVDNLVIEIMGPKFQWFTPYAIYLLLYIGVGNLLSLFGWEPPISSYTVAFCLGFVTFIGLNITSLFYKRGRFFLKYIKNPNEIIGQFSPLISISFRIFGNITAGSVILYLFYDLTKTITHSVPVIGYVDILGGIFSPLLNIYFDIFDGLVQTYIFLILTLAYISIEAEEGLKMQEERKKKKNQTTFYTNRLKYLSIGKKKE